MRVVKYVIVNGSAIVFSGAIVHRDMVGYNQKCEGAGFVSFYPSKNEYNEDVIQAKCFGESFSLGVSSRGKEDEILINSQILNPFL
jgi:hypothetical protein